jgi:hypothetical protein
MFGFIRARSEEEDQVVRAMLGNSPVGFPRRESLFSEPHNPMAEPPRATVGLTEALSGRIAE